MTTFAQHIGPVDRQCYQSVPTPRNWHGIIAGVCGGLVVLIAIFATACASKSTDEPMLPPLGPTPTTGPAWQIGDAATSVHAIGEQLPAVEKKIELHATSIEQKAPPKLAPSLKPDIDGLHNAAGMIPPLTARATSAEKSLAVANEQAAQKQAETDWWISYGKGADAQNTDLKKQVADAKSDAAAERSKALNSLLVAGGVLFVASIVAVVLLNYFFPGKLWFLLLLLGPALGAYAIAADISSKYLPYLVIGLIVCVLAVVGCVAWRFCREALDKKTTIKTLATSFGKVVETNDAIRDEAFNPSMAATAIGADPDELPLIEKVIIWQKTHIFGASGIANTIQDDPHTWRLVDAAQGKPVNVSTPGALAVQEAA